MKLFSAILVQFAAVASLKASDLGNILTPLAYAPKDSPAAVFSDQQPAPAPPSVVTSMGDIQLGEGPVLDALRRELTDRLSLRGDLKLAFVEPWTPVEVKNGREWKLVLDGVPKAGLSSISPIRFSIEADGKKLGTWETRLRAQLFEPVWVTTRRVERGESLNSSVAALKEIDVFAAGPEILNADADLRVFEVSQPLVVDTPINRKNLSLRRLVRRGKVVDVVMNRGALNISMKGIALSDGGAGETIGIRNIDSKKDFQAQVVGDNTVEVKF